MRETLFIKQNNEIWKKFHKDLDSAHKLHADDFVKTYSQVVDNLCYANTFYQNVYIVKYLNYLAIRAQNELNNHAIQKSSFSHFWIINFPLLLIELRKEILLVTFIFLFFCSIGFISSINNETYIR